MLSIKSFFAALKWAMVSKGFHFDSKLIYVVPNANWSLDWEGYYLKKELSKKFNLQVDLSSYPEHSAGNIIHYSSLSTTANNLGTPHSKRNSIIATVFHGDRKDPDFKPLYDQLFSNDMLVDRYMVSNQIMFERFLGWGVDQSRLCLIPIGVDTEMFSVASREEKRAIRNMLGIPEEAYCIGSFQKDGVGWEEGIEPKLVKGPDVFVDVINKLAKRYSKLHILLTGPSRGYVKQGLDKAGVSFSHYQLDNYFDLPQMYKALDCYLVTSREE
jgi:glycosyltransferase involved in cell wall biosynthesis